MAIIDKPMGRKRINGAKGETLTARFPEGTLARIKEALRVGELQAEFIREAVDEALARRES